MKYSISVLRNAHREYFKWLKATYPFKFSLTEKPEQFYSLVKTRQILKHFKLTYTLIDFYKDFRIE